MGGVTPLLVDRESRWRQRLTRESASARRDADRGGRVAVKTSLLPPLSREEKCIAGPCSGAAFGIYETEGRNVSPGGEQMSVESLQELFLDELKDLYSAEKQ